MSQKELHGHLGALSLTPRALQLSALTCRQGSGDGNLLRLTHSARPSPEGHGPAPREPFEKHSSPLRAHLEALGVQPSPLTPGFSSDLEARAALEGSEAALAAAGAKEELCTSAGQRSPELKTPFLGSGKGIWGFPRAAAVTALPGATCEDVGEGVAARDLQRRVLGPEDVQQEGREAADDAQEAEGGDDAEQQHGLGVHAVICGEMGLLSTATEPAASCPLDLTPPRCPDGHGGFTLQGSPPGSEKWCCACWAPLGARHKPDLC